LVANRFLLAIFRILLRIWSGDIHVIKSYWIPLSLKHEVFFLKIIGSALFHRSLTAFPKKSRLIAWQKTYDVM